MKNKKAAMEMSMGMIVTIVLIVSVMILGIILIQKIGGSAKGAIDLTDKALKNELNKLFSSSENRPIIVYPETRVLEIKKGKSDQFAFLINNIDKTSPEHTYSYEIIAKSVNPDCTMSLPQVEKFIGLGKTGQGLILTSGSKSVDPIRVSLSIPEQATLCDIRYGIDVTDNDGKTTQSTIDLFIK